MQVLMRLGIVRTLLLATLRLLTSQIDTYHGQVQGTMCADEVFCGRAPHRLTRAVRVALAADEADEKVPLTARDGHTTVAAGRQHTRFARPNSRIGAAR